MTKEQKHFLAIIILIVLLAGGFGVYAFLHKGEKTCKAEETDAIKFKREYEEFNGKKYDNTEISYFDVNLSTNNLFKYIKAEDAVKFLKEDTGVIYFGFPQCPWCRTLVPYLEEVGKNIGVKKIYYLNISEMRDTYEIDGKKAIMTKEGSKEYYELLEVLDKYLDEYYLTNENGKKIDTGVKRLYAPTTVVVNNGKIVDFLKGTVDTQEKFVPLTDDEIVSLKKNLTNMFAKVSNTVCTNEGC
ncbi:MAG: hypothetical protein J5634_02850 [Bacilli bacterium]|nr:hypothetical protein [Bacilli bacterium]